MQTELNAIHAEHCQLADDIQTLQEHAVDLINAANLAIRNLTTQMNKTTQKEIGEAITRAIDLLKPTILRINNIKLAIVELETDLLTIEERLLAATKTKDKPNKNQPT